MPRYVLVRVDDERITDLQYTAYGYDADGREYQESGGLPVPPDDQWTRALLEAIALVEMTGWSHRHKLVARLRLPLQANEGSE